MNQFQVNDIIGKAFLKEFKNNLSLTRFVQRQWSDDFNATTGTTIRIRRPNRFTVRDGEASSYQDVIERKEDFAITQTKGVDLYLTMQEQTLEIDDQVRRIVNPAALQLANMVDVDLYNGTTAIYHAVGTPGTAPGGYDIYSDATAKMNSFGTLMNDRWAFVQSNDASATRKGLYNVFNQPFNDTILKKGLMGNISGFDFYDVQHPIRPRVTSLANVAAIGTPAIKGAGQSGATITIDGLTASTIGILQVGAIFTIANVYAVNPISRNVLNQLQQFTITSVTDSDSSGNAIGGISFAPYIVLTGPYQSVSAAPADNALLVFQNQHTINVAMQSEACTLAVIKYNLSHPNGAYMKAFNDEDAKISIVMTRQLDIDNFRDKIRFDIWYGSKWFGEYACRIMGS